MINNTENIQWKKDKINLIVLSLIHKVEIENWKVRSRIAFYDNEKERPKSLQDNIQKLSELQQELENNRKIINDYVALGWENITLNKQEDIKLLSKNQIIGDIYKDKIVKFHTLKKEYEKNMANGYIAHHEYLYL